MSYISELSQAEAEIEHEIEFIKDTTPEEEWADDPYLNILESKLSQVRNALDLEECRATGNP